MDIDRKSIAALGVLATCVNGVAAAACDASYDGGRTNIERRVFWVNRLPTSATVLDCQSEKITYADGEYLEVCSVRLNPADLPKLLTRIRYDIVATRFELLPGTVKKLAQALPQPLTWAYWATPDAVFADVSHEHAIFMVRYSLCPEIQE